MKTLTLQTVRSLALAAACAWLLGSCGKSEENVNSETATTGSFQLVADEVLRPAIDSLVDGFLKENPHAKVTVKYVSAGEAMKELLNKEARAIVIDRGITPVEQGLVQQYNLVLPEFDMAEDGIGCIVSASNPLGALALSDLARMFKGEAQEWSSLKRSKAEEGRSLPTGPIEKILPGYPSSTEYVLDSMFLERNQVTQGHLLRFSTTDSIVAKVKADPSAIGFIGGSWKHWLASHGDTTIKVVPIIPADSSSKGITKPIILHLAYIYQGLYPLTTRVTGFSFENANTLPRGFLAYAMTAHGQTVFKNFEILPKTQIIKIVPAH